MSAYYNEFDPKAAAWLRELIKRNLIAPGDVDERSILEVRPDDLRGFTQCHFFAGIGVWSYALRRAGWADDRPVWTGSCPCQPFSAAGKGDEFADERHLWPAWFRLARELRPDAIFGEQVSSKDALAWFDHVRTDLEGEGYALGVLDTCAAGVGAPHIRQRLYFVADAEHSNRRSEQQEHGNAYGRDGLGRSGNAGSLAYSTDARRPGAREHDGGQPQLSARSVEHGDMGDTGCQGSQTREPEDLPGAGRREEGRTAVQSGPAGGMGDAGGERCQEQWGRPGERQPTRDAGSTQAGGAGIMADATSRDTGEERQQRSGVDGLRAQGGRDHGAEGGHQRTGPTNGFWANAEWIPCRDGKARPTQSRLVALASGVTGGMVLGGDSGKSTETEGEINGQIHGVISEIGSDGETEVRGVRDGQEEIACSSRGQKSIEQRAIEFAHFVCLLPSARALAELSGDAYTAQAVSALLQGVGEAWAVQHASDSGKAIWESLDEESKDRIEMGFNSGRWIIKAVFPLAFMEPARVTRLRGYGNAINAEQAKAFIESYIEVRADL